MAASRLAWRKPIVFGLFRVDCRRTLRRHEAHGKVLTEELLAGFELHDVTEDIARHAGILNSQWKANGFTLGLIDMMIAATAITHGLVLVTGNRKDFPMPEPALPDLPASN